MDYKKAGVIIFFFSILLNFIFGFLFIKDKPLFVDENTHYFQINKFFNGDFSVSPSLTTIPGYHYTIFLLSDIFGFYSMVSARFFSLIFSFISIIVFFALAKRMSKDYTTKIFQYAFFPILFPFFFLIYTDFFSLVLILFALYFVFCESYEIAGIFGILSFFARQNNVIWMAFLCALIYYNKNGLRINFKAIREFLKDIWVFILGFIIAIVFIIINGGFAVGDKTAHPAFSFHFGNVFFILFLFFFLFLPLNIYNFFKIIDFIKKKKLIWIVVLCIFLIYIKFFIINHPYNFLAPKYFLRNMILQYFIYNFWLKIFLFLPIIYSILSLCVMGLKRKEFYLLYPFSILFLIPSWLIEQRYYFIPLTLFILFKKEENKLVELITIVAYVLLSLFSFYGIGKGRFFL